MTFAQSDRLGGQLKNLELALSVILLLLFRYVSALKQRSCPHEQFCISSPQLRLHLERLALRANDEASRWTNDRAMRSSL